ncbi:peptidylprolyl isomerase [Anatilimnocola floriformis]|uniref:peptidylprolyl isomerase n=1 Tax=Anatilimnocola floriformis TaxID=2948575 RepID=UPI0020C28F7A|nr:peptidylprolyl isomerase [Anatilimnocola floriformis]
MQLKFGSLFLFSVLSTGCIAFGQPADPKAAPAETKKADDKKPEETKAEEKKPDEKPAEPKAEEKPEAKPEAKPANTPAEKFNAVQTKWNEIDQRLNEIAAKYSEKSVDAEEKKVLKGEYTKLIADSQTVLVDLRKAAEAAFQAEPNKDPNVTRTLIGMVAFNVRRDENELALELGNKLIEGKCDEPVLLALAGTAAYRLDDFDTAEKYLTIANKAGRLDPEGQAYLTSIPAQKKAWAKELETRAKEAKADDLPRVKLETNRGTIVIELFENEAPGAVGNFVSLVEKKFYDNLTFHRVLPNFMAQGGDPSGNGTGGPGYNIYCECEKPEARMHFRGSLSMAHAGKDTGGSQFFLTFLPTTQLNSRHTVFGRVIEGFDVLAKIQRRDPQALSPPPPDRIVKAEVIRKRDHAYAPNQVK